MGRSALVTGPTGQDGSYLVELLLLKGYDVLAMDRSRSRPNPWLDGIARRDPRLRVLAGDLMEHERVSALVRDHQPDEVYNLAAQSFVPHSWDMPVLTTMVDAVGPVVLLEAIRRHSPRTRFYQASSSEIFGKVRASPQDEATYHHPRSPYGAAKSFGMNITRNYRESFGLHASNGILFNHESERRGPQFVTRKITSTVARIKAGTARELAIGNLDARRDWGHAEDYVRAMWLMLQQPQGDDYVVASGQSRSIRDFVEAAFAAAGIRLTWSGEGLQETGRDASGTVRVRVDPDLVRPAEVDALAGDAGKARRVLGWSPTVDFGSLVARMVRHDLAEQGVPALPAR